MPYRDRFRSDRRTTEYRVSATEETRGNASLRFIASAWPLLQPHVRETILTLIDAVLAVRDSDGDES
jgi:hypothetical protein